VTNIQPVDGKAIWFTDACKGMLHHVSQEVVDPVAYLLVGATPILDVFLRLRRIKEFKRRCAGQFQPQFLTWLRLDDLYWRAGK